MACSGVECYEVRVKRSHVDAFAPHGEVPVRSKTAKGKLAREIMAVLPEKLPVSRAQSNDVVRRFGEVHHPVYDERYCLNRFVARIKLIQPLQTHARDCVTINMIKPTVVSAIVRTRVRKPVCTVIARGPKPAVGDRTDVRDLSH